MESWNSLVKKKKNLFVLGGGDCGVLREILKHSPKFVTMVEVMIVQLSAWVLSW